MNVGFIPKEIFQAMCFCNVFATEESCELVSVHSIWVILKQIMMLGANI